MLEVAKRPAVVWAAIGTCTSVSRSVQIWVISNLVEVEVDEGDRHGHGQDGSGSGTAVDATKRVQPHRLRLTSRRWDWKEVGVKAVLPAGVLYFVMAWADEVRREWGGC